MACEFDALADLEELQIEKSPDTPNTRLQIACEPRTEHFLSPAKPQSEPRRIGLTFPRPIYNPRVPLAPCFLPHTFLPRHILISRRARRVLDLPALIYFSTIMPSVMS